MQLVIPDLGLIYRIKKIDNIYTTMSLTDDRSCEFNVTIEDDITPVQALELIGASGRTETMGLIRTGIIQRIEWTEEGVIIRLEWP